MINEELNQARIEQKITAKSLNTKERAKLFDSLKGSKFILLKAEDKRCEQQKEKLNKVNSASPVMAIMHSREEELHDILK